MIGFVTWPPGFIATAASYSIEKVATQVSCHFAQCCGHVLFRVSWIACWLPWLVPYSRKIWWVESLANFVIHQTINHPTFPIRFIHLLTEGGSTSIIATSYPSLHVKQVANSDPSPANRQIKGQKSYHNLLDTALQRGP